ncbi:hypothetical protein KBA27_00115, partial [bacterium]|nr:hypothetical protein [bacterium]
MEKSDEKIFKTKTAKIEDDTDTDITIEDLDDVVDEDDDTLSVHNKKTVEENIYSDDSIRIYLQQIG